MPEIRTDVELNATPERAWSVLCAFARYPEWNPFMVELKGTPAVGEPVDLRIKARWITTRLRTTVIVADPNRELRWRGHFVADDLVMGEHYFQFEPIDKQRTRFIHGEQFTGKFAPLAWRIIGPDVRNGYARMNEAFKARVESGA